MKLDGCRAVSRNVAAVREGWATASAASLQCGAPEAARRTSVTPGHDATARMNACAGVRPGRTRLTSSWPTYRGAHRRVRGRRHHPQSHVGGGRERTPAVKGPRDRRHRHQADRHLDRDQRMVLSARGFGGQGEQLPHHERLLLQARPRGDPVPSHAPGRHLLLQNRERVPDGRVQGGTVAGVGSLGVVQQDQVEPNGVGATRCAGAWPPERCARRTLSRRRSAYVRRSAPAAVAQYSISGRRGPPTAWRCRSTWV